MSDDSQRPATNEDLREALRDATDSLRHEFTAHNTTTGVQIGAVDKSLRERMDTLKWRMVAALLGGQVLAGVAASIITNLTPRATVHQAAAFLSSLL